jgi:hypothetical protein
MLAAAKSRLPHVDFEQIDLTHWRPGRPYDVIFASASLQWLPDCAFSTAGVVAHGWRLPRRSDAGHCSGTDTRAHAHGRRGGIMDGKADAGGHIPTENWLNQGLLWLPYDLVRFNRCLAHDLLSYAG